MSSTTVAKENVVSPCRIRRRRCKFIGSWLNLSQFASWLEPLDDDRHKAYCALCDKIFSVAHGGLHDVRAHWRGKRHIGLEIAISSDDYNHHSLNQHHHHHNQRHRHQHYRDIRVNDENQSKISLNRSNVYNFPKVSMDQYSSSLNIRKLTNVTSVMEKSCVQLKGPKENEVSARPRHLYQREQQAIADRVAAAVAAAVEVVEPLGEEAEEERRSQNAVNSFWPSGNLEGFVEAEDEDVREIDDYEDDDIFDFENQFDDSSNQQIDNEPDNNFGLEEEEEVGEEVEDEEIEQVDLDLIDEEACVTGGAEKTTVVLIPSSPRMLRDQQQRNPTGTTTPAQTATMSNMFPQQYCLRWKYHHSNLQTMFSQLLERQAYCDVTLACEGQTLRAHKVVLSACSTYFDTILSQYEEKDPIVIMRDVKFSDIKVLVEFMYKGEINIDHTRLSSLLKTAEDLHIKGLAEVSWRSDSAQNDLSNSGHSPGAAAPGVEAVLREGDIDDTPPPKQRRRGRPPLDDPPSAHDVFTPKITCFTGNEEMSEGDHESCDDEMINEINENPLPVLSYLSKEDSASDQEKKTGPNTPSNSNATNPAIPEQFRDVVKMNDYLAKGRRQEFWEEPFTRRVMDAIKSKELEMKTAAEILGVSYGTLYGRYRDSYGCLKHPYRVRDFWSEPGPAEVLAKLRRKEITLFRAAEFLNVTVHTLATYLSTLQGPDRISLAGELSGATSAIDINNDTDNETVNDILQKFNANVTAAATPTTSTTIKREGGGYLEVPSIMPKAASSVLENNPDITIVKTESIQQQQQRKREYAKVSNTENNNAKLMSGGAVSEVSQQQKLSDTLSLNNDNSKP